MQQTNFLVPTFRCLVLSRTCVSPLSVSNNLTNLLDVVALDLELCGMQFSGWLVWDDVSVSLDEQVITGCCYGQRLALSGCRQGLLLFIITNRGPGGWNGDSWDPLQFMGQDLVIKLTEVADNQQIFPAMAQIVEVGVVLYDTYDELLPELNNVFMGFRNVSFLTLLQGGKGGYGGCAGLGRGQKDCPSNTYYFQDRGFHADFRDGGNQVYHVWPYIANVGGKLSLGGIGLSFAQLGNYYHEIIESRQKRGGAPGSSWQDYFLSEAGMEIGVLIATGDLPITNFADHLRWRLGSEGPGSYGKTDMYQTQFGPLNVLP